MLRPIPAILSAESSSSPESSSASEASPSSIAIFAIAAFGLRALVRVAPKPLAISSRLVDPKRQRRWPTTSRTRHCSHRLGASHARLSSPASTKASRSSVVAICALQSPLSFAGGRENGCELDGWAGSAVLAVTRFIIASDRPTTARMSGAPAMVEHLHTRRPRSNRES